MFRRRKAVRERGEAAKDTVPVKSGLADPAQAGVPQRGKACARLRPERRSQHDRMTHDLPPEIACGGVVG